MNKIIDKYTVVVIGKESVGKTQLVSSFTGKWGETGNFRGTTVSCTVYETESFRLIDTPGIIFIGDIDSSRMAIEAMEEADELLLVVNTLHADSNLSELLPLAIGKRCVVVLTFWDKFRGDPDMLSRIEKLGIPVVPVDARKLSSEDKNRIRDALNGAGTLARADWDIQVAEKDESGKTIFDLPVVGTLFSLMLLFLPTTLVVVQANALADYLSDPVFAVVSPLLDTVNRLPIPLSVILGGNYGVIAMFPFLLLYALPTVLVFAILIGVYKASGLIDSITICLHPVLSRFGLSGRDLVRVIMGFGCNVPAVINSRACSSCTRAGCIKAISFGSACSYQLPATIAVFRTANMEYLAVPFLVLLVVFNFVYLRLSSSSFTRNAVSQLLLNKSELLVWPRFDSVAREAWGGVRQFVVLAFPVFLAICMIASLAQWAGLLSLLTSALEPIMRFFNLPSEAATAVILGSIRKDGIAIGLLNADWDSLRVGFMTPIQVLTVVFLAGSLLPCLVTLYTIVKEMGVRFAAGLVLCQMLFTVLFCLLVTWIGFIAINYI